MAIEKRISRSVEWWLLRALPSFSRLGRRDTCPYVAVVVLTLLGWGWLAQAGESRFSLGCGLLNPLSVSGRAARVAVSPERISSVERAKSSYLYPLTSGSMTRSAAAFQTPQFISCAMAKHWPITSNRCRGPVSPLVQVPRRWTANTFCAPISRTNTYVTERISTIKNDCEISECKNQFWFFVRMFLTVF